MARIRSVKPEFFTSQSVARLSMEARLAFIGIWTEADDYGRLVDSAKLLAGSLFPHDDMMTSKRMEAILSGLAEAGMIHRYEVGGDRYFEVVNWDKHQRVSHKGKTNIPGPTGEPPVTVPPSAGESPESRRQSSGDSPPRGRGSMEQGSMEQGSMEQGSMDIPLGKPSRKRPATPLPDDLALTAEMRRWPTARACVRAGLDLDDQLERFKSYHQSRDSRFVDWHAAVKTWLANAPDFMRAPKRAQDRLGNMREQLGINGTAVIDIPTRKELST